MRGADPTLACCSGPLTLTNSKRPRPLERHCRPLHSHAGTLVTTVLKLRVEREKRKKVFQCLLLGTPGTGWGRLAWKESSMGAGGYRMGTSRGYVQRRGAPISPNRAELAHGGGMHVRERPAWSVPTRPFAEGALEGMGLGVAPFGPCTLGGGALCTGEVHGMWGTSPCHPPPRPGGVRGRAPGCRAARGEWQH